MPLLIIEINEKAEIRYHATIIDYSSDRKQFDRPGYLSELSPYECPEQYKSKVQAYGNAAYNISPIGKYLEAIVSYAGNP